MGGCGCPLSFRETKLTTLTTLNALHLESLGEATTFVARMREIIDPMPLFESLDAAEIADLARYMSCFRAPPGKEIIHEGEAGDFMLLVLEGTIEITKQEGGLPQRLVTVGPGKTVGEMSLIDGEPRFASCIALTMIEFAVLDRQSLARLIHEAPRLGVKLMMELLILLNQRLRSAGAQLMDCMAARRLRIR
jgi:CRP-like cAMP-binding protein